MIRVELPVPPSLNNMYVNVPRRGRVPSKKYAQWRNAAGLLLNAQKPGAIAGNVQIQIQVPKNLRGDIDNRQKGLLDLLVTHGVIEDDRRVSRLSIERADVKEAVVEIAAADTWIPLGDAVARAIARFAEGDGE